MNSFLVVFLKEVRENLRDRRTVLNTLLTGPLFAPLLFVLLINTVVTQEIEKAEKALPLPIVGAQYAPNLVAALKQQNVDVQPAPADAERAVREQDADVVLRIGADFATYWDMGEPAQIEIIYDASQRFASTQAGRLRALLEQYSERTGALRLLARGLSPKILKPLSLSERDQSTPQSRASQLFAMLPYFFILGGFIGGMALAIDTTSGERERQSLEPLLANPVPRWQILGGKLGATSAFALTSVLLSVLAFAVVGRLLPAGKTGMALEIGPLFAAGTMLVMLPLTMLLATLQTLVAAFAKSYREAQTYVSLLMFVPAIPTMMLSFAPVKTQTWMYAVPLLSQQVIITRLLRGDFVPASGFAMSIVSTVAALTLAYAVATAIYRSERLAISA
jgi:sodium transport system permease protein